MDGTDAGSLSLGLAFVAGLASFVSPCVLPLVPSYVTFITGMTLDELSANGRNAARRRAAIHSALFVLGFGLVFVALGATATLLGATLRRLLPLLQQIGGAVIGLLGLYLLGVLRLPWLMQERRIHLASRPAGLAGSVVAGMAFGAGWTPCVGPVLASILLYAGISASIERGILLLVAYTIGLGVPFFFAAVAFNWYLAGARRMQRWLLPLERIAGAMLLVIGILLFTGYFTRISRYLAGFGQLFS